MANGAKYRSGLATLMQDHLSDKVVNTLVNIMPLVYIMLARDGNKQGNITGGNTTGMYGLGRFASGKIISGVPFSKPRREEILNSDTYEPIVQTLLPPASDGKVMGLRDTMPRRTNWTTVSPGQYFNRPYFKWVERADPLSVPKKELRRTKRKAKNEASASLAVGDLMKVETESVLSTHLQWWNQHMWGTDQTANGYPSNQDADTWDDIFSIRNALRSDNEYGGVDRMIAANAYWRGGGGSGIVSAHMNPVLEDLINYANYQVGLFKKGVGVNLMLCGPSLFPVFAAEAKAKGGEVMLRGLPEMQEVGYEKPVIRFNNTYVLADPECPDKLYPGSIYSQNAVAALNVDTWTFAISPDANFTVDDPFDQSRIPGNDDAITSNIRTEMIQACEAPGFNVWFDNVG